MSSVGAGLIASLCCGGSLVFASIGLGAFYGALGLSRYIPQVLAVGTVCIVAINYLFYSRAAKRVRQAGADDIFGLRQSMFVSAALGLVAMAVSFVFLEWLNHAVVSPHRFLSRPEYGQAFIPGVPNVRLLYAVASFWALALLWASPWPLGPKGQGTIAVLQRSLRVAVFAVTAVALVVLVVNAVRGGAGGHGGGGIRVYLSTVQPRTGAIKFPVVWRFPANEPTLALYRKLGFVVNDAEKISARTL